MKIVSKHLDDVLILEPTISTHGLSTETSITSQDLHRLGITTKFVQDNHSRSIKNVLRGLHYQIARPQGKLIRVVSGSIFDVVVDLRRTSPNFGKAATFVLSEQNGKLVWIPPGYAHGFLVTSDAADVLYSVTDYRSPEHERTILWCDPDLAINWPLMGDPPVLSEKDRIGLPFNQADIYTANFLLRK
jgi:dTDP-4-dehydrorhamnose 3,5-epimerase